MNDPDKLNVLIVEDEQNVATTLSALLEVKAAACCEIAADCASARAKLPDSSYDLITLDYQLPDGDGLSLLRKINSMENPPPVIMVTGQGDEQTAAESFRGGASGYVVKDARMGALLVDAVQHA